MNTVPTGAAMLLDFVYRTDAGSPPPKCYETIFGNRQSKLAKPLTSMTLGEVIEAQKTWATKAWAQKFGSTEASSAAGAAQFMRDTLIGLSNELALSGTQIFDANLQDRLGYELLKRRGYADYMAGKIDRTEFGKRLAQEWASFPVLAACKGAHRAVQRGETFYAGDNLNMVLVAPERVEQILLAVRKASDVASVTPMPSIPPPAPQSAPAAPVPQAPSPAPVDANKTAGVPPQVTTSKPSNSKASGAENGDLTTTPKGLAVGVAGILVFVAAFWATAEGWFAHLITLIEKAF